MPNKPGAAQTICPYYLNETPCSVTCEGLSPCSSIVLRFRAVKDKQLHKARLCDTFFYAQRCPMARALDERYEMA